MLDVDEKKSCRWSKRGDASQFKYQWDLRASEVPCSEEAGPGWDIWPMGDAIYLLRTRMTASKGTLAHGTTDLLAHRLILFFQKKNVVTSAQSRENILMQHIFSHFLIFLYLSLCPYILYLCLQSIVCFCYRWTCPWARQVWNAHPYTHCSINFILYRDSFCVEDNLVNFFFF